MTILARARVILEGDTIALTKALAGAEAAMQQTGTRMANIGRTLTMRLSLPMAAVGAAGVKLAADFDNTMRQIEGLVGVSRAQIEAWEEDIRAFALESGRSAKEAGEALYFITSAGVRGSAAMDTMRASLQAAAAGLGETKVIADAATSAMNAYGQANMTAERAIEIMVMAVREGKMEANAFAPVMGRLLPIASAMGISFEQVAGIMAVFSRTGVEAAEGATSLSAMMSVLLKPSKQGAEALAATGMSMAQLRDMARGPTGLIEVMRLLDKTFGDNEEVLTQIIPNIRALRGVMNVLAQDTGVVDTMMRNVANSQGVLASAFEAMRRGPLFQMHQAWEKLKEALLSLGKALIPIVVPAMQAVGNAVLAAGMAFEHMDAVTKRVIVVVGLFVVALGPAIWSLGALLKATAFAVAGLKLLPVALATASRGFALLGLSLGPGSVLIVGLGVLAALFFRAQLAAARAAQAAQEASEKFDQALSGVTAEQAAARVARLDRRIAELRTRMGELRTAADPLRASMQRVGAGFELLPRATAQAGDLASSLQDLGAEAARAAAAPFGAMGQQERLRQSFGVTAASIGETITQLEHHRAVLQEIVDAAALIPPTPPTPPMPPGITAASDAVKDAMAAFTEAQRQVRATTTLLGGTQFEELSAETEAYRQVVLALVAAGVSLNAVIGPEGETLAVLAHRYEGLRGDVAAYAKAKRSLSVLEEDARSIIEATLTPLERYQNTMATLRIHLEADRLTQEQFNRAVQTAQDELDQATGAGMRFGKSMEQWASNALNSFVDFTTQAQQSFRDFANAVIRDLERIAIRLAITEGLKALGVTLPGFAAGGFLPGGQFGLVGEAGPELVSAGRSGLTIQPLAGGDFAAGSPVVVNQNVTLAVSAVDQRGVAAFLDQNRAQIMRIVAEGVKQSRGFATSLGG